MSKNDLIPQGSVISYIVGLLVSMVLTLSAYVVVTQLHFSSQIAIMSVVLTFAMTQLVVQLIFFLHLLHESKPRWNLVFFVLIFGTVLLVVVASIWIMQHLNYNMMPKQIMQYVHDQQGGF